jgi:hypothetical protein
MSEREEMPDVERWDEYALFKTTFAIKIARFWQNVGPASDIEEAEQALDAFVLEILSAAAPVNEERKLSGESAR